MQFNSNVKHFSYFFMFIITLFSVRPSLADLSSKINPRFDGKSRFQKAKQKTAKLKFGDEVVVKQDDSKKEDQPVHPRRRKASEERRQFESYGIQELQARKNKHIAMGDKDVAIKYVERAIALTQDQHMLKDLRLQLADLNFDVENFEDAAKAYNEYIELYPGSSLYEYAAYRAISATYNQMLDAERDQAMTRETITQAKKFLANPNNNKYRVDVEKILQDSYQRLFDAEVYVFHFYLRKNRYACAQKRLDYIKAELIPHINNGDAEFNNLEEQFAAIRSGKSPVVILRKKADWERWVDSIRDGKPYKPASAPKEVKPKAPIALIKPEVKTVEQVKKTEHQGHHCQDSDCKLAGPLEKTKTSK